MHAERRTRLFTALAGTSAIALVLGLSLAAPGAASDPAADEPVDAAISSASVHELTLVTGDSVTVEQFPDGQQGITIDPADRAEPVTIDTLQYGGQTYVLPSDAAPLVPDVLDRELFNVTKLVEYGYTDGTPVIVQYERGAARTAAAPAGLEVTSTLASIDAVAGVVDDSAWWRSAGAAPAGARTTGAGVAKAWLNERVEADLADSVPIIGAPELWAAGFDGAGMTIAVLDTGVDDTHPDLAGKVTAEENFSAADTVDDVHGHGTHVSGIALGAGADSGGQFTGVAPGAELLSGKVLADNGTGTVEGVIAGMEWAVDQGADVVNLSLGTREATDGADPMAQALNQLSEEHDVLFVTSAGNSGSAARTVGSPGSADHALTVGSVAKTGVLASTSSRGPRLGDDAVKPDVTAPGVSITSLAIGGGYRSLSGTSMASPHVAGAAALLLQSEPDLSAMDLKAALSTTGVPRDGLTVYQQGGGRIDVPAAFNVPVLATPAPLNLGFFPWPHDDAEPAETEITYTNRTDEPITLDLELDVTSSAGHVSPAEMLSVTPDTLTVEPGAAVSATVTLDVTEGELGLYGGHLIAEDGGEVVTRTPVGFHKEPEMQTLRVEGIARNGRPAGGNSSFHVVNVEEVGAFVETAIDFVDGAAELRVPTGTYAVMGMIFTYQSDGGLRQEQVLTGDPEVEVFEDTTVVLDAREASPVVVETPGFESQIKTNPRDHRSVLFFREADDASAFLFNTFTDIALPVYAVPTDPVTLGDFEFTTRQRLTAPPDLELSVLEPEPLDLHPVMARSSAALAGEFEAPLIDVGNGLAADYEGIDAEGAVALARRGGSTLLGAKAAAARDAGAIAVLVVNDEPGPLITTSSSALPALGLSKEEGDELIAMLADGEVTVRLVGNPSAPVLFDLVLTEEGHIRDDLTYVADADKLAELDIAYHADVADVQRVSRFFSRPRYGVPSFGVEFPPMPLQRTEYLVAEDMSYQQGVLASGLRGRIEENTTSYEPGQRTEETWFKRPFRPGIRAADSRREVTPTARTGNSLQMDIREWVDAHGHGNWGFHDPTVDTTAFRLYQNGELIAQSERAIGTFSLSPDPATHRLELDVVRDADWWLTSTETHTAWTVQSAGAVAGTQLLPVLLVDYDVDLDLLNTAPHPRDRSRPGPPRAGLQVGHQPGLDGPPIAGARAWVSYDDGDTWRPRPTRDLGDGAFEVFLDSRDPDETTGFVSLRVEAWDTDNNRIDQDIIRAWKLAPR